MTTIVVDYGSGNLRSAAKAFERAASDAGIVTEVKVSSDADAVRRADRIVLPGVGAFADCRRGLAAVKGTDTGWNELELHRAHPVLAGLGTGTHAYFVHSYAISGATPSDVLATAAYGGPLTAVVARDNLIGTQFHPEKSQAAGL